MKAIARIRLSNDIIEGETSEPSSDHKPNPQGEHQDQS
jgi:hypothetical protein